MTSPSIFLSYSHRDEKVKDRFLVQLKVLESAGFDLWNDDRIAPGGNWKDEIDEALTSASVAILVVTANFLTSDFILNKEVPEILERHRRAGLKVYPVLAKPCAWEKVSWLATLNIKPKNGKPVWRDGGRHIDKDLADIAREVADALQKTEAGTNDKPEAEPEHSQTIPAHLKPVEEAIADIDAKISGLAVAGKIDLSSIASVIRLAISYGAPLYNRGSIKGCAEIYHHAASTLSYCLQSYSTDAMALLDEIDAEESNEPIYPLMSLPGKANSKLDEHSIGLTVAHDELYKISRMNRITEQNANRVAWDLRYTFDHILLVASGMKAIDKAFVIIQKSRGQLSAQLADVIKFTNSFAAHVYNEGLMKKKWWIRGSAAIYLHTLMRMLATFSMLESLKDEKSKSDSQCIEAAQIQLSYVKEIDMLARAYGDEQNAYYLAWDIRLAFDRILDAIG